MKYLGLHLDRKLVWNTHISNLLKRLRYRLKQLAFLLQGSSALPLHLKRLVYLTILRPMWMYGGEFWGAASDSQVRRVQTFQNRVLRLFTGAPWFVRNSALLTDLKSPLVKESLKTG